MTPRAPFGSHPGEIASVDIALALRRRERERAAAAERVREKLARSRVRRLRAWLAQLSRRMEQA